MKTTDLSDRHAATCVCIAAPKPRTQRPRTAPRPQCCGMMTGTRSSLVLQMGALGSTTHESCARRAVQGRGGGHRRPTARVSGSQRPTCSLRRRAATAPPPCVGLVPRNLRLCRLSPCLCHNPNMFKNHDPTRFSPVSSLSLACARRRATGGWFSKSRLWPRARIGPIGAIPKTRPVRRMASPGAILSFCAPPLPWPRP